MRIVRWIQLVVLALTAVRVQAQEIRDVQCGAYCLYVAALALDVPVKDFDAVSEILGPAGPEGYTMGRLAEGAKKLGLESLGVETTLDNLSRRPGRFACIAHVKEAHFVLLGDVRWNSKGYTEVDVIDPPAQTTSPADAVDRIWKGKALLLATSPLISESELPLPRRSLAVPALILGSVVVLGLVWNRWRMRRSA